MTSSPLPALPNSPLHLTVRFSSSIPDLELDIPSPQATTVVALKVLLRSRLATTSRLRLIYQGRILPDSAALGAVLKQPLPPPPAPAPASNDVKGKGKDVERFVPIRVYVNCSIGDELSEQELASEQAAADRPPDDSTADLAAGRGAAKWTRPRPHGFDRLLQAGFSPSEIATLRTQFASIRTQRFTSDSLPSPDTLRSMEDAWIDSNAGELSSPTNPAENDLESMFGGLDTLIRGLMVGFFFPLGSVTWLLRQDIWSERWYVFVGSGVVLSLTVGVVINLSGERST